MMPIRKMRSNNSYTQNNLNNARKNDKSFFFFIFLNHYVVVDPILVTTFPLKLSGT